MRLSVSVLIFVSAMLIGVIPHVFSQETGGEDKKIAALEQAISVIGINTRANRARVEINRETKRPKINENKSTSK